MIKLVVTETTTGKSQSFREMPLATTGKSQSFREMPLAATGKSQSFREMPVCLGRDNTKIFIPRFFPEQLEGSRPQALEVF